MPFRSTNGLSTVAASELMPTISTSSREVSWYNSMKCGISFTHGGHHVAQKSNTTRLPRRSASESFRPSSVVTVRSGAATPSHSLNAAPPPPDFMLFCNCWKSWKYPNPSTRLATMPTTERLAPHHAMPRGPRRCQRCTAPSPSPTMPRTPPTKTKLKTTARIPRTRLATARLGRLWVDAVSGKGGRGGFMANGSVKFHRC